MRGGPKQLSETMKRKGEGEGSSEPKKKRSRKDENDIVEFLKEKATIDLAMKQEDQKARREEHEREKRLYELQLGAEVLRHLSPKTTILLLIVPTPLTFAFAELLSAPPVSMLCVSEVWDC